MAKNKDSINIKYNSVQSAWISIQTNTENIGKIFLELSDVIQKSIEQIQMVYFLNFYLFYKKL